eukprot:NODE_908_length_3125_cov_1.360212.p1 type:complete len:784 gc:universal NODE_908_length_3125_cov_1.360212:743-3094(+)
MKFWPEAFVFIFLMVMASLSQQNWTFILCYTIIVLMKLDVVKFDEKSGTEFPRIINCFYLSSKMNAQPPLYMIQNQNITLEYAEFPPSKVEVSGKLTDKPKYSDMFVNARIADQPKNWLNISKPESVLESLYRQFQKFYWSMILFTLIFNIVYVIIKSLQNNTSIIDNMSIAACCLFLCVPWHVSLVPLISHGASTYLHITWQKVQLLQKKEREFDEEYHRKITLSLWNVIKNSFSKHPRQLVERLANISIIAALDKTGTISHNHPSMFELILPHDQTLEIQTSESGVRFSSPDWEKYTNSLRPIGLILLMNTNCHKTSNLHYRELNYNAASHQVSCYCTLAKEIGFDSSHNLSARQYFDLFITLQEDHAHSRVYQYSKGNDQIVIDGDINIILSMCSDYWDGEDIFPISEAMRKKFTDIYTNCKANDIGAIAYAYSPVDQNILDALQPLFGKSYFLSMETGLFPREQEAFEKIIRSRLLSGLIFLGISKISHKPKSHVRDLIEEFNPSSIRFVYFSPKEERPSKAFAERLGLETDWNSYLLLSNPEETNVGYQEEHDIKAQLPRGIAAIKEHLRNVDDIPLHVSLFAEASPTSITEMLGIFQYWGESVAVLGSCLNSRFLPCFAAADISVGLVPRSIDLNSEEGKLIMHSNHFVDLFLSYDASLFALYDVIKDARTISSNLQMFVIYGFLIQLNMLCSALIIQCSDYQYRFTLNSLVPINIIIILQSLAFLSLENENSMKLYMRRNKKQRKEVASLLLAVIPRSLVFLIFDLINYIMYWSLI